MRAIRCIAYGEPSHLFIEEIEDPVAKPGEVVVAVEAAGLGYVDALLVRGTYQVKLPLPFIPGSELAGAINSVGEDVSTELIGRRVMARALGGALADRVALSAMDCVPIPQNMTAEAAAGFIVSYNTALFGLSNCGAVREGETVLVLGASGGVGIAAIDVAKALGARVIAAASSPEKRDSCLRSGADQTVDYGVPEWRTQVAALTANNGVDVV